MLIVFIAVITLSGCITTKKAGDTSQLQMRVTQLEQKFDEQDTAVKELSYDVENLTRQMEYAQPSAEMSAPSVSIPTTNIQNSSSAPVDNSEVIRVAATGEEVQAALKGAGYYNGPIDGKIGKKSQQAIADFQRDNGLKSDGIVGRKTWAELQRFLQ
jgi:peptidoglycan hydrolase-like protein with peptidoglycan-binding domain